MFDFLEVMKRIENGEYMKESEFDLKKVASNAKKIAKKYNVVFDAENLVISDQDMINRAFMAGLEMAETVGIFCSSTSTVARFTRDELLDALKNAPSELRVGNGTEAKMLYARKTNDTRYPLVFAGNAGAPMPEDLFMPTVMSYMKEPLVDGIDHSSITTVDGMEVKTGSPLEIRATRRELTYLRTAATMTGRPGIPLICAESSGASVGDLSVAHPNFIRPGDIHLTPLLSEMKTDYHNLCKVANNVEIGTFYNGSLPNPIVGGYAGGPAETAITEIANFILAVIVCQAHLHLCHPVHIKYTSTTHPQCLWVLSIVGQAFANNTNLILVGDIFASNGAGTETLLYETAANALVNTISGMHQNGIAATNGLYPNSSGLEARLMGEVGRAVVDGKLTLEKGNQIVLELLGKYQHTLANPELGKNFREVYNMDSITPKEEWLEMYNKVKKELKDMGLALNI